MNSSLLHNLQYGVRQLRRNPGFTVTVVVTLALSIGANTAIFSIVNALLLKSLPYSHPERIGAIYTRMRGTVVSDERHHIDGEQWELLRDNVPALISAISSIRPSGISTGLNFEAGSRAQYVTGGRISAHYLDVLEIRPIVGRNFSETEDVPGGAKTAILSYNLWRNAFGAKRDILGQTILLKGAPYTVIGVLPEGVTMPLSADVYTAIQGSRQGEGSGTNFDCIMRLRDGATWQEADAEINRAWGSRPDRYELQDDPSGQISYYSVPLQKGETDPLRPQVLTLMLAAGLILLIACANLAGLTLVRVLRRTPEIATRVALGASHWQIQKQLWVENLVLAFAGGIAGVVVGFLALRGLLLLLPEHFLPVSGVSLDGGVLAFTALISVFTSVLFGMLPALTTRRFDLRTAMGNRQASGGDRLRLRQILIATEVALTVVLLAAAGLLVRTLVHLQTLPPGFNPDGVMTARASLDEVRYHDDAAFRNLLDESTAAMRRIPGVQTAAVGLALPYERTVNEGGITIDDGREKGEQIVSGLVYVTPDYFSALQIPLTAGRYFTESDGPNTQHVAIINQTFVRKFFHDGNPIGRHLLKDVVIVGVVEDVAMEPGIDRIAPLTAEQTMYVPAMQVPARQLALTHMWFQPSWIVRTSRPIEGLTARMQRALASVDPDLPFSGFYRMQDLLAKALVMQSVEVALLSTMAALALILSAVGIFALVANIVTQRTREIGIRMALGSTIREAIVHVGVPGVRASAIGLVIGLSLCAGVLRVMRSVLYGVGVYDAPAIISAVLLLAAVSVIAMSVPALRIARIDPAKTLREE
ncbi:MAG TPA: ABC transporter permease [Terriglobales bacterium]|nr:ABC transporter permease [Terriglobales bacterium]